MKKKWISICCCSDSMSKILLKMKLITFFLLVSMASVTANSYSQQAKFTMNLENGTVSQVFQKIENTSEFIFIYSEKSVDVNRKVNVKVEDETVISILDQLFKETNNIYEIHDRQIVILSSDVTELPQLMKSGSLVEQPQKIELTGTVKDGNGLTLPGVNVIAKGTTIGAITDIDGKFRLSVPPDTKVLVFSFIGMKSQEFPIAGKATFNVVMMEEAVGLDEVIAVGYGTQKKVNVVGAISQVNNAAIVNSGQQNITSAIAGKLSGVLTMQTTGQPGADDAEIVIRGLSSWNGSQPLVLVDGVERDFADLDPNEVESISVLKDASSTAVFGARGANGVIIVTTKRGTLS